GCVVGRDPEVSVPIPDLTCSRRQFSVVARNGTYEVQPLSPGVPTLRNGVVLTSPQALSHDDRITCGTTTIVFLEGGAGFSLPRQAERPAPPPASPSSHAQATVVGNFREEMEALHPTGEIPLNRNAIIGRAT